MMNISLESLSLIEDMVSGELILRKFFLFSMAISKNKTLLLIKDYSRNITIYMYVLSKYPQLLASKYFLIISIWSCNWHSNQTKNVDFYKRKKKYKLQSSSPRMLQMKFGLNLPCGVRGDVVWMCWRWQPVTATTENYPISFFGAFCSGKLKTKEGH